MSTKPDSYSRREFMSTGAVVIGSAALTACDSSVLAPVPDQLRNALIAEASCYAFVEESGQLARRGLYIVAALQTTDPFSQRTQLVSLRGVVTRVMSYSSTDETTLAARKAFVEYLPQSGMRYTAVVVNDRRSARGFSRLALYLRLFSEMGVPEGTSVNLQFERRSSGETPDPVRAELENIPGVTTSLLKGKDVLQEATDIATGCIYGDGMRDRLLGRNPHGARNSVKDEMIGALRQQLGVRRLADRTLAAEGRDFRVISLRPPF